MDRFNEYSLEELLLNEDFRRKVMNPQSEEALEFREWLSLNFDKNHKFRIAAEAIRAVQPESIPLSKKDQQDAVHSILNLTSRRPKQISARVFHFRFAAAAATILLVAGWFLVDHSPFEKDKQKIAVENSKSQSEWRRNTGQVSELIRLSDGSTVVLRPGSSLRFPAAFEPGYRKVELKGEAFFEISRDTLRPFYVYANESVTRVLGTSFNIRAYQNESEIVVKVHTGKVAVSHIATPSQPQDQQLTTFIEPYQQLVMDRADAEIKKTDIAPNELMSMPLLADHPEHEIPVGDIFSELQRAYGVIIAYDHQKMSACSIMANIDHLHLMEKIDAICIAMNATYRIEKGRIVIVGDGC